MKPIYGSPQQFLHDCRLRASDCLTFANRMKRHLPFGGEAKQPDSGVVLGLSPAHEYVLTETKQRNVLIAGSENTGKGVNTVIPTCLAYQGNLFVFDSTGEAYRLTSNYRKRILGQNVIVLSTDTRGLVSPALQHHWNPFLEIRTGTDAEEKDVAALATAMLCATQTTFPQSPMTQVLLERLIAIVLHSKEERSLPYPFRHLAVLVETFLAQPDTSLILERISLPDGTILPEAAANADSPAETSASILTTLQKVLQPYLDDTVDRWTKLPAPETKKDPASFSLREFAQQKGMTIYFVSGPKYFGKHYEYARLFYFLLASHCQQAEQEHKTLIHPLFLLDDAEYLFPPSKQFFDFWQKNLALVWTVCVYQIVPKFFLEEIQALEQIFPIQLFLCPLDFTNRSYVQKKLQEADLEFGDAFTALLFVKDQPPMLVKKLRYYEHGFWKQRILPVKGKL